VLEIERGLGSVDLLFLNAGVARLTSALAPDIDDLEEMIQVNYLGSVYAVAAALPGMLARRSGHLVGICSLSARQGLAWSAAYSASKVALATYLESLRPALRLRGIHVTSVFPGFVRTAMSEALPLRVPIPMVSPHRAAARIVRAATKRRREVSFPRHQAWVVAGLRLLPMPAFDALMARLDRTLVVGRQARG
jgi:short-subunit dehydrogenase